MEKLPRRTKLMYGAGDIGFSLTSTIIGAYFLIFMTDVVGVAPGVAAIAIFIGRSWDYINDPIFGHLSDRTRSRWGRRRPYLLFGPLPYALAFTMLWFRPPFERTVLLVAYYALAYILYDAAATAIYMPYFALTPELTEDYDERTSLTTYRMFFSILGSLLAFTVPLLIVGSFNTIVDPELVLFAEADGKAVGWLPGIPNLNEAFIHVDGLRHPWDYVKLWWYMRRQPECLAVKSVLVLPEYWGTGVSVLLFAEMGRRAKAKGYKWLDLSLTSADNPNTPVLAERMGAKLYKRYRVYRLPL